VKPGDISISSILQADGLTKQRPVVLLAEFPPYGDWLIAGISTQTHHHFPALDEIVAEADSDFRKSGLHSASLIRGSNLMVYPATRIRGRIGMISAARLNRLLTKLSDFLRPQ
jgi:mRNA interferase MazF